MSELAPGKWTVDRRYGRGSIHRPCRAIVDDDRKVIAWVPVEHSHRGVVDGRYVSTGYDEWLAIAHRLAAANEMRDVLESLVQPLLVAIDLAGQATDDEQMLSDARERVRLALAAAEVPSK